MVDSSGSVGRDNFAKVLNFVLSVVHEMSVSFNSTRVGLITFSTRAYVIFYLDKYGTFEQLRRGMLSTPYRYGDTYTADALRLLRDDLFTPYRGDRPDVPNYAVVITDGVSNIRNWRTIAEAHRDQDEGIHIFSIGIGLTNLNEIYSISSEPSTKNTFLVSSFDQLADIKLVTTPLVGAICGGECCNSQVESINIMNSHVAHIYFLLI